MDHLKQDQIWTIIEDSEKMDKKWLHHLEHCSLCQVTYIESKRLHDELSELTYHRPSVRFAKNIYELLIKREQLHRAEQFWIPWIHRALFLSLGLVVVMLFWLFHQTVAFVNPDTAIFNEVMDWSLIIIISTGIIWIIYIIDRWYGSKLKMRNEA